MIKTEIDPDIVIEAEGMPDDIKAGLIMLLTNASKKYNCHWTGLSWSVEYIDNQPIIKVKKK